MNSKELFKEGINVFKALKTANFDLNEVQVYLTSEDGEILEFCIDYDEEGNLRKTMDAHDTIEELWETREDQEDEMTEITENVLLN